VEHRRGGGRRRTGHALNLDAQPTTRAIRAKADTPDEIDQMFDGIAYGKASDVLLMVENYLGEETFRKGVHAYLAAHEYATPLPKTSGTRRPQPATSRWTRSWSRLVAQPGEPLLTFGAPANGKVSVAQKRFFLSPSIHARPAQKWTCRSALKPAKRRNCELTPEIPH
jgi:aminopeptidase N